MTANSLDRTEAIGVLGVECSANYVCHPGISSQAARINLAPHKCEEAFVRRRRAGEPTENQPAFMEMTAESGALAGVLWSSEDREDLIARAR